MAFPDGTPTVTLVGTLPAAATGAAYSGQVVLRPSAHLIDSGRNAVYPGGGKASITNGSFSIEVLPTNAAGIAPEGWRWWVDVQPTGGNRISFWAAIEGADGATIQLADLTPVPAPGGGPGPGPAGASAYEVAVTDGFDGTVEEWLASLVGPAGAQGPQGLPGEPGEQGPPGSNADAEEYTDTVVAAHAADTTGVHGIADTAALETAAGAAAKVAAHTGAADPHGDRAYADTTFATITVVNTLTGTVTTLSGNVSNLDTFVNDCLNRVAAIEQGTAFLTGVNSTGNVTVHGADLQINGTGKAYRFRRGGGGLDYEGAGADLIFSMWQNADFTGTQRSYDRYSSGELTAQHAGKREFVDALYGATRHVVDGTTNTTGWYGAAPVGRQTVTGSRGGNAALASLLTALDTLGWIDDQTTA